MKYLSLILIFLSFAAFANRDEVPCDDREVACFHKTWKETLTFSTGKYFAKGIGANYAAAEENADKRLHSTYKGITCGTFGSRVVHYESIRLRDGRNGVEAWVACNPGADAYKNQKPGRKGVCLGCGTGKGGVIITGPNF